MAAEDGNRRRNGDEAHYLDDLEDKHDEKYRKKITGTIMDQLWINEPMIINNTNSRAKKSSPCQGSIGPPFLLAFGLCLSISSVMFSCCFIASLFSIIVFLQTTTNQNTAQYATETDYSFKIVHLIQGFYEAYPDLGNYAPDLLLEPQFILLGFRNLC